MRQLDTCTFDLDLGLPTLTDVVYLGDEVERFTGDTSDESSRQESPNIHAVLPNVALLHLKMRDLAGDGSLHESKVEREVVGMSQGLESGRKELRIGVAENPAQCRVDLQKAAVQSDERHTD